MRCCIVLAIQVFGAQYSGLPADELKEMFSEVEYLRSDYQEMTINADDGSECSDEEY